MLKERAKYDSATVRLCIRVCVCVKGVCEEESATVTLCIKECVSRELGEESATVRLYIRVRNELRLKRIEI